MPTVEGKAYWASVTRPNTTFDPVYQIDLAVDEQTAKSFKRKVARADGTKNPMPRLVDSAKNPIDVLVGNGSKVKVLYKPFDWKFAGKSGTSLDLQAVQVIDLVPYGEDFDVSDGGYVAEGNNEEF
mgnify:CR=1 FL=1